VSFWILLLTAVWCMLSGKFDLPTALGGLAVSTTAVLFVRRRALQFSFGQGLVRFARILSFLPIFMYELLVANIQLSREVFRPVSDLEVMLVEVELEEMAHAEVVLLTSLITLTPGTMCVDVTPDGNKLYIHTMLGRAGADALRTSIQRGSAKRVKGVVSQ